MGLDKENAKSFEEMAAEMDATEAVAETTETADTGGVTEETKTEEE